MMPINKRWMRGATTGDETATRERLCGWNNTASDRDRSQVTMAETKTDAMMLVRGRDQRWGPISVVQ